MLITQSIPGMPSPPGIYHLVGPGGEEFVRKPLPGVGHLSILVEAVNIVPFSILVEASCGFRFITTPQYFLHPSKKFIPAIVISSNVEEKQSTHCFLRV